MSISSTNLKALNVLVHTPVTQDMIHKIVVATLQVLPCQESNPALAAGSQPTDKALPSLMTFLTRLVRYTNVYTGTLMATLVYLNRLKNRLPRNAQGLPCTRHRILLLCLILSSKNHNDSSPKNIHWAEYTDGLFSVKDINLMERQLLFLLNWDLLVSNEEMCQHLAKFLEPIKEDLIKSHKMKKYLQQQQQQQQQQRAYYEAHAARNISTQISRSSSTSSNLSLSHMRQNSSSSVSLVSSQESSPDASTDFKRVQGVPFKVDPRIEYAALNEQRELNKMLEQLRPSQ